MCSAPWYAARACPRRAITAGAPGGARVAPELRHDHPARHRSEYDRPFEGKAGLGKPTADLRQEREGFDDAGWATEQRLLDTTRAELLGRRGVVERSVRHPHSAGPRV